MRRCLRLGSARRMFTDGISTAPYEKSTVDNSEGGSFKLSSWRPDARRLGRRGASRPRSGHRRKYHCLCRLFACVRRRTPCGRSESDPDARSPPARAGPWSGAARGLLCHSPGYTAADSRSRVSAGTMMARATLPAPGTKDTGEGTGAPVAARSIGADMESSPGRCRRAARFREGRVLGSAGCAPTLTCGQYVSF